MLCDHDIRPALLICKPCGARLAAMQEVHGHLQLKEAENKRQIHDLGEVRRSAHSLLMALDTLWAQDKAPYSVQLEMGALRDLLQTVPQPPGPTYYVDCCNAECGWTGLNTETVHPKHHPLDQMCPHCNEVTEPAQVEEV